MNIYSDEEQEALQARNLLKQWSNDGLINTTQYEQLNEQTPSNLRTTNIFLRLVLFFFTVLCVAAATVLLAKLLNADSPSANGVLLLFAAIACYAGAEIVVTQARLYHHGIEEGLLVASVAFLYLGLSFLSDRFSTSPHPADSFNPASCAILSLWIWRRFDLWYLIPIALACLAFVPGNWTQSLALQHVVIAAFYAVGILAIIVVRVRHRDSYLDKAYSLAEAFLWLALYLAINLKVSAFASLYAAWNGVALPTPHLNSTFYWLTWTLTWCLPPIILTRALHQHAQASEQPTLAVHQNARPVLVTGGLTLLLTFLTNKPYLGWPRHTWDPILLGVFLTGVALFLRRWLAQGPEGIRHGFTAARLSGKDQTRLDAASAALGLLSPHAPTPQPAGPSPGLDGGASGGAGASRTL